jgi:hypothetical protein
MSYFALILQTASVCITNLWLHVNDLPTSNLVYGMSQTCSTEVIYAYTYFNKITLAEDRVSTFSCRSTDLWKRLDVFRSNTWKGRYSFRSVRQFATSHVIETKFHVRYRSNSIHYTKGCHRAMPWLRSLVAGLSPRRPRFAPGSIHVGFVVVKVALGQVFLRVLRFSRQYIIPPSLSETHVIWGMRNMLT